MLLDAGSEWSRTQAVSHKHFVVSDPPSTADILQINVVDA